MVHTRRLGWLAILLLLGVGAWWTMGRVGASSVAGRQRETERPKQERPLPWAASAKSPPLPVVGHVLTEDGSGLLAQVCTTPVEQGHSGNAQCLATSAQGEFELAGLRAGEYSVSASAPGHLPASQQLDIPRSSTDGMLRLVLKPGGVLVEGQTVDATGGPVGGAVVALQPSERPGDVAKGLSDDAGRFSLFVSPGQIHVTARATGYAAASAEVVAPASAVSLVLPPAATIVGRVVSADSDAGVAGATVTADPRNGLWAEVPPAQTQEDGSFRMDGVTAGSYALSAHSEGLRSGSRLVHVGIGTESESVILPMTPAVRVSGTVLAGEQPCADGRVQLAGPAVLAERTSSTGGVTFEGVWAGEYAVTATCQGAVPGRFRLSVGDEGGPPQEWRLSAGHELHGTVTTGDGLPAEGVRVQVTSAEVVAATQCITDTNGAFRCAGLPPGNYRCVVVGAESTGVDVVVPSEQPIAMKLRPSGTIRALLDAPLAATTIVAKGEDGVQRVGQDSGANAFTFSSLPMGRYQVSVLGAAEPVVAELGHDGQVVEVQLSASHAQLAGRVVDDLDQPVVEAWVQALGTETLQGAPPVLTDENGEFSISDIAPGRWHVTVTSPLGETTLENADTGQHHQIRLSAYGSISGTVATTSGEPVTSFRLVWTKDGEVRTLQVSDPAGQWSLPWLEPGLWVLGVVSEAGSAEKQVELTSSGAVQVELRVDRGNAAPAAAALSVPANWGRDDV